MKIAIQRLTYILYVKDVNNCYNSFSIPKKSGGLRNINAPNDELRNIQRKLSDALWKHQQFLWRDRKNTPQVSHAFEKNKSIITNATIHRNKRFLFNVDLENFFDCFHFGRVQGYFMKNKDFELSKEVATVISQLACYNGKLPQGSPCSPIITNLICQIFDYRVLKIAKKYKLDYTRYADDLSFSTNDKAFSVSYDSFFAELSTEIESAGFKINDKKTRLQYKDSKQVVTGLIVNKKINVDRNYFRETKAMAHSLYVNGEFFINGKAGTLNQLEGRFAFINQLDKYNRELIWHNKTDWSFNDNYNWNEIIKKKESDFWTLNGREKQYQEFLVYKYLYANNKPLIITEGKTDIVYLKSALKNLHTEYPDLIEMKDGKFVYKVSFLKRRNKKSKNVDTESKDIENTLTRFMNISTHGADTLKNIYNFFSSKGDKDFFPNYLEYFNKLSNGIPQKPVILIFDNELEKNEKMKPLRQFVNYAKLTKEDEDKLQNTLNFVKLTPKGNLYLVTNNLVNAKKECEIEDLFTQETLNQKLGDDDKEFKRKMEKGENEKYYSKEIFSRYVAENYTKIDFNGFKGMLDNINNIVKSYPKIISQDSKVFITETLSHKDSESQIATKV